MSLVYIINVSRCVFKTSVLLKTYPSRSNPCTSPEDMHEITVRTSAQAYMISVTRAYIYIYVLYR
jgi:hypothetical protein